MSYLCIQFDTIVYRVKAVPDCKSAHSSIALHPYTAGYPAMLTSNRWNIFLRDSADVDLISLHIISWYVYLCWWWHSNTVRHRHANLHPNPLNKTPITPPWGWDVGWFFLVFFLFFFFWGGAKYLNHCRVASNIIPYWTALWRCLTVYQHTHLLPYTHIRQDARQCSPETSEMSYFMNAQCLAPCWYL